MACRLVGAKPLSELMMVNLLTHLSVTRPKLVKDVLNLLLSLLSFVVDVQYLPCQCHITTMYWWHQEWPFYSCPRIITTNSRGGTIGATQAISIRLCTSFLRNWCNYQLYMRGSAAHMLVVYLRSKSVLINNIIRNQHDKICCKMRSATTAVSCSTLGINDQGIGPRLTNDFARNSSSMEVCLAVITGRCLSIRDETKNWTTKCIYEYRGLPSITCIWKFHLPCKHWYIQAWEYYHERFCTNSDPQWLYEIFNKLNSPQRVSFKGQYSQRIFGFAVWHQGYKWSKSWYWRQLLLASSSEPSANFAASVITWTWGNWLSHLWQP